MTFVNFYAANRPYFQRGLRVAFLVYFLVAAVHAVTGPGSSSRRGTSKSSGKGAKRDGKPPRVAVRCTTLSRMPRLLTQRLSRSMTSSISGCRIFSGS